MKSRYAIILVLAMGLALLPLPSGLRGQERGLVAKWSFEKTNGPSTVESVKGANDKVGGYYEYVPGVSGAGLRFDGYTTSVQCKAADAPQLRNAFSIEAWVALNTYPWNWAPIVDQEVAEQSGYFFGIDAFGRLGLKVSVNGVWQTLISEAQLPLKKWVHVGGTYDAGSGLKIYLNGKPAGELRVTGELVTADRQNLLIGRIRQAMLPVPAEAIHPVYAVWYSLDGILDEVEIYDRRLAAEEIQKSYAAVTPPAGEVLPWPALPSGPAGAGRFGAYYYSLKYQDTWDRLRRMGPDSDVVVRFDQSPIRLVFWQGTNYIPAWVTENNKWYTDEFLEVWDEGCPDGQDCEPMSDKQSRYSHVEVLESNDARAVVHWRYALAEVENYKGALVDPNTGWFDWADEYWTVYPNGTALRKQVLWTSVPDREHEWQETIVINGPGQRPEENINWDALTLENMKGETAVYNWRRKPDGTFSRPDGPHKVDAPTDPNIQIVNVKSAWKPFQILPPFHPGFVIYGDEKSYFSFECWNHWPVAQIASSGRPCLAPDRASHSSLSNAHWDVYSRTESTVTKIMMDGLTTRSPAQLLPLAKSWISAPKAEVEGGDYRNEGYDPTQGAFILSKTGDQKPSPLVLTIGASEDSPAFDPAIVVKNWGGEGVRLKLGGKPVAWGRDYRRGLIPKLQGTDLVVWLHLESVSPVTVSLESEGK